MIDLKKVADEAEVIIAGFAFTPCEEGIRIINLNNGRGVAVVQRDGILIESNMDDIEYAVAKKYLKKAKPFMEKDNAEVLSV